MADAQSSLWLTGAPNWDISELCCCVPSSQGWWVSTQQQESCRSAGVRAKVLGRVDTGTHHWDRRKRCRCMTGGLLQAETEKWGELRDGGWQPVQGRSHPPTAAALSVDRSLAFRRALDEPFSTWGMGKDAPLPHRGTMAVSGDISGYGSWG